jgi:predicted Zn-dependent protease
MNAVIVTLKNKVYPYLPMQLPISDPPQRHRYTMIFLNMQQGTYTPPPHDSPDYLEYVLPFLAFISETKTEPLRIAVSDLKKALELNPHSVLAPYFLGLVYEHTNRPNQAKNAYQQAYNLSHECYPAVLGLVRIMDGEGQKREAVQMLQDLAIQYPDTIAFKQELAAAYYRNQEWSRAESAIKEILQRNNALSEFLLMQAHTLVEQGKFFQAIPLLDRYGAVDPNNKQYLFLRARIQAEGYHNPDAALNYMYALLKSPPVDEELLVYAAGLLLESGRPEDQAKGGELLQRLLAAEKPSLKIIDLAFQDAVRREAWEEAKPYLNRLLEERPLPRYFLSAYKIAQGLGNTAEALAFAQEFHRQDPANEEGTIAYISALIARGQKDEAARLLDKRLAASAGGTIKAQYYYLRSRISGDTEAVMRDLRACLFEDPRNLNALIKLFEIYHRQGDKHRAVYYLKQALSFAPDDPQLRKHEMEYREEG